jgi:hypothetical protein
MEMQKLFKALSQLYDARSMLHSAFTCKRIENNFRAKYSKQESFYHLIKKYKNNAKSAKNNFDWHMSNIQNIIGQDVFSFMENYNPSEVNNKDTREKIIEHIRNVLMDIREYMTLWEVENNKAF